MTKLKETEYIYRTQLHKHDVSILLYKYICMTHPNSKMGVKTNKELVTNSSYKKSNIMTSHANQS